MECPPVRKTIGVCLIPSLVPKSEGYPSAGSGQAFDFAQYRLRGTLIVVGIEPGDQSHLQIVIEYSREVVHETQKNIHRPD
jgi:hypothetical protein